VVASAFQGTRLFPLEAMVQRLVATFECVDQAMVAVLAFDQQLPVLLAAYCGPQMLQLRSHPGIPDLCKIALLLKTSVLVLAAVPQVNIFAATAHYLW
jgi:hypothetical protein